MSPRKMSRNRNETRMYHGRCWDRSQSKFKIFLLITLTLSAWPLRDQTALKSINQETVSLDRLQIFSYCPQFDFYTYYRNLKFLENNFLTRKNFFRKAFCEDFFNQKFLTKIFRGHFSSKFKDTNR